ncbi:hypothetical protein [Aquimarina pacifica]|uniref:hypothetical protein n=1 Tax=Aquimarina pacifica TaxID=1296415 RepID=UPI000470F3C9|nr:hypothetical protein [Aquimarina pacifica]
MFLFFAGHAHDADKAYFKIHKEADNVVVFAEFPWSIRKVLDNIKTENSTDQNLQIRLLNYIKKNIILENNEGDRFPIVNIEFLKNRNEGHHSTVNYKIFFKGDRLFKVTNTIMCDYFKNQQNYHELSNVSHPKITNAENTYFIINQNNSNIGFKYYLSIILVLFIIISIFLRRKLFFRQ